MCRLVRGEHRRSEESGREANEGLAGILCVIGSAAACGGSEGGTGGTGGNAPGTGGSTSSTTATSSGTGGAVSASVNGCDPSTAEDHTGENPMMLMFGGAEGLEYTPRCAKIKAGSGVMFMGDLAAHPLAGGVDGVVDPSSPSRRRRPA